MKLAQAEQNTKHQTLLYLAVRGFDPKLHCHCTPEVHMICECLEAIASKILEGFERTAQGPARLTDAELRGVHVIVAVNEDVFCCMKSR